MKHSWGRLSIDIDFLLFEIRRVSSVLNKDNKNYGKKNLIDGSEETCWNSEAVRFLCLRVWYVLFLSLMFRVLHNGYRLHRLDVFLWIVLLLNFKEVLQQNDLLLNIDNKTEHFHRLMNFILMIMANYKYPFFCLYIGYLAFLLKMLDSLILDKRLSSSNGSCHWSSSTSINILW